MIEIDPRAVKVHRSTCTFCSFGCELGIMSDDLGIRGVEYVADGVPNSGRLCPRGSASAFYLNHPRRLSAPMKNGQTLNWDKVVKEMKRFIKKPDQVAVTFDRNLTREEYHGIMNFCRQNQIEVCASAYLEPESRLSAMMQDGQRFSLDELDAANVVVIVGDLFQLAPMTSKHVIEWRYRDRKNRLVVIDSLGTYTGKFAADFLKVGVGCETLALLAMAGTLDEPVEPGLPAARFREIGENLKNAAAGLVMVTMPFGRCYDPAMFVQALENLSKTTGKKIVPFVEHRAYEGNKNFGYVLELVKARKIKQIINFGETFPYRYPQIASHLKNVELYATAMLKPSKSDPAYGLLNWDKITLLPGALNIEKNGTVDTTFGSRPLKAGYPAASGTQDVTGFLARFGPVDVQAQSRPPAQPPAMTRERIESLKRKIRNPTKERYLLVGDKSAFNFMAFWEPEPVRINPSDARRIGIRSADTALIRSNNGEAELPVELSDLIPAGVLAVPAETGKTRCLFDLETADGSVNFPPTEVELCRKE